MPDEEELIRRIAPKDHLAFKMLVDLYRALVLKTCCSLLDDRQNAEDVTQDVFSQIYKSAPVFRHDCRLSTWIRRIAINRCLNFNRDNKKFRWLASLSQTPEEELRGGERSGRQGKTTQSRLSGKMNGEGSSRRLLPLFHNSRGPCSSCTNMTACPIRTSPKLLILPCLPWKPVFTELRPISKGSYHAM